MPNYRGTRLMENQTWSQSWPGKIDCGNGLMREPFEWRGTQRNRYWQQTNCAFCGMLMLADRNNYRRNNNSFCSQECKSFHTKRASTGNKRFKKRDNGRGHHVMIVAHDHHRADGHGLVYEHILVAEKSIGRPVNKKERVHHINCVKSDNRPENLFVCDSDREHFLIHASLNDCVAELIDIGVLVFDLNAKKYMVKK